MKATKSAIKKAIKKGSTAIYKLAANSGIDVSRKSLVLEFINQVDYMNKKHFGLVYNSCKIEDNSSCIGLPKGLKFWRDLKNAGDYKKVALIGHTRIYMCSPEYGHSDYNNRTFTNVRGNHNTYG